MWPQLSVSGWDRENTVMYDGTLAELLCAAVKDDTLLL